MYLELETELGEEGDIRLVIDTDTEPESITLTLINKDGETTVDSIDKRKLAQFVVNCRRYITIAHEDSVMSDEDDDDEDDDDDD